MVLGISLSVYLQATGRNNCKAQISEGEEKFLFPLLSHLFFAVYARVRLSVQLASCQNNYRAAKRRAKARDIQIRVSNCFPIDL